MFKIRSESKMRFLQNPLFFQRNSLIFEAPGSLFGGQIDPTLVPNRIIDAEGVIKPIVRPLDGSWSGLEGSWCALGVLLEGL